MAISSNRWLILGVAIACIGFAPIHANAQSQETLAPYAMLRSLQYVQDSVARGDHSAAAMQRFMLSTMDQRLRTAPSAIFKDPRNVDAALIYAMSGGNPATLELLVARDIDGNFDNRVADVLRKYLDGRGTMIAKSVAAMVPEYRGKAIGAYLALITANVTIPRDPVTALGFYDIARLEAPGTIIEEAALRRSLAIAVEDGDAKRALGYAERYARRFVHSPYSSQFADLLVALTVQRFGEITVEEVEETLSLMDPQRQREVYLRMARMAAVAGKDGLARLASAKAKHLSADQADGPEVQANLYQGLSNIGTPDVVSAIKTISEIPDEQLSQRDRALREAARVVAEEVVRPPSPPGEGAVTLKGDSDVDKPDVDQREASTASPNGIWRSSAPTLPPDSKEYRSVLDTGRSKLDQIDALLKKEGTSP